MVALQKRFDPLLWTYDIAFAPPACSPITLTFLGGCPPYKLSAFYYDIGNQSSIQSLPIGSGIVNPWYTWTIAVPINTELFFQLKDSAGTTILSSSPIQVITNGKGRSADVWCFRDDDDDVLAGSPTGQQLHASDTPSSSTSTSALPEATKASDATQIEQYENQAHNAKVIEGVLAGLSGVALLALLILGVLFFRLRRKYKQVQVDASLQSTGSGSGTATPRGERKETPQQMSEKKAFGKGLISRLKRQSPAQQDVNKVSFENDSDSDSAGPHFINPFDEDMAGIKRNLGRTQDPIRGSTSSLATSDVPSSTGQYSTKTGQSGISTEFYHRTKASTIINPKNKINSLQPRSPISPSSSNQHSDTLVPSSHQISPAVLSSNGTLLGTPQAGPSGYRSSFGPHSPSIQSVETVIVPISRAQTRSSEDYEERRSEISNTTRQTSFSGISWDNRSQFTEREYDAESIQESETGSYRNLPSVQTHNDSYSFRGWDRRYS